MSYLDTVSEFLVTPVLRQARRLSQSLPTPLYGRGPVAAAPDPNAIDVPLERAAIGPAVWLGLRVAEQTAVDTEDDDAWIPTTTSPIEETEGLGIITTPLPDARPRSTLHTLPLRLASMTSDYDGDVSDNPSFSAGLRNAQYIRLPRNADSSSSRLEDQSSRPEPRAGSEPSHHTSMSLPADDGMGALRESIKHIQSMDISTTEKAHLMHRLLTREYTSLHKIAAPPGHQHILREVEEQTTAKNMSSTTFGGYLWQMNGGSGDEAVVQETPVFKLSPKDLARTFATPELNDAGKDSLGQSSELPALGCQHYKRNVKLQCSACERWYTCRMCHDEVEDHILIRKATKYMLCMLCGCAQKAAEFCASCEERTAWYYCDICKLWDNDTAKNIYHCHECGICRKGRGLGKDFFHCKTCGTCMSMAVEHSHRCIERVSDCDCPICGEYMFTSPKPVVFMPCGHGIHHACYHDHMKSSYKCPICSKSAVNMETQFRNLDRSIEAQPMPPQFRDTKAMVLCNDCHAKSAVTYHWLGLKCAICDSYNTAQLSILSDPTVRESHAIGFDDQRSGEPTGPHEQREFVADDGAVSRRHSMHALSPVAASPGPNLLLAGPLPQRLGRSMSPPRGWGILATATTSANVTDSEEEEDDLDFWGNDAPRSVTSADVLVDDVEADDEDSSSEGSDCEASDGDCDDDDVFDLLGHR